MPLPDAYLRYGLRRRGMDHDRYAYRRHDAEPRPFWPDGKRIALVVVPIVEWYPLDMQSRPAGIKVPGGMERPYPDYWNYTMRDYGTRVGLWRIVRVLDRLRIRASAAVDGATARRHPSLIGELRRRDWEILAHGVDMSRPIYGGIAAEAERAILEEALDDLRAAGAGAVSGWMSPAQSQSLATLELLAAAGLAYTVDWNIDDEPVAMRTDNGTIYAMPCALETNDRILLNDYNLDNAAWAEQLLDGFGQLWREAAALGRRMVTVSAHSWLVGQPHRIRTFERVLAEMLSHRHVWPTTYAEVHAVCRAEEGAK
jgi:allantoinase